MIINYQKYFMAIFPAKFNKYEENLNDLKLCFV
jgi:hypothetical protein